MRWTAQQAKPEDPSGERRRGFRREQRRREWLQPA
jgi:hypothetical protein